jgi:catechol 2,3-dioxygenase-like lactoylglutathione lyase family enzyme
MHEGHIGEYRSHLHMTSGWPAEMLMSKARKARAIGLNHVALEVGDIDEALAFYGRLFAFELRGRSATSAFIDLGDQFLALQKGRTQEADHGRHFGFVVDDKDAVSRALTEAGIEPLAGPFLDFLDPWGNRVEIVGYDNVQFTKAPHVLRGMGLAHLSKSEKATEELARKGMAPE